MSATADARVEAYLRDLQDRICAAMEAADGGGRFDEETWVRPEGGGGRSRVMKRGAVFEQAGIGLSVVEGRRCRPRPRRTARSWPVRRGGRWACPWCSTRTTPTCRPRT